MNKEGWKVKKEVMCGSLKAHILKINMLETWDELCVQLCEWCPGYKYSVEWSKGCCNILDHKIRYKPPSGETKTCGNFGKQRRLCCSGKIQVVVNNGKGVEQIWKLNEKRRVVLGIWHDPNFSSDIILVSGWYLYLGRRCQIRKIRARSWDWY